MVFLISIFLSSSAHGADQWCKLVRLSDGKTLTSFFGKCEEPQWGGEWGDAKKVKQEPDPVKQAQYLADEADREAKAPARAERRARLESECPKETGVLKDLCFEVLNKEDVKTKGK